jgi:short subunit dehydrogenase
VFITGAATGIGEVLVARRSDRSGEHGRVPQGFRGQLLGAIQVVQAMVPMLRRSRGRIINTTSASVYMTIPMASAYPAAKAAPVVVDGATAISDNVRLEPPDTFADAVWKKIVGAKHLKLTYVIGPRTAAFLPSLHRLLERHHQRVCGGRRCWKRLKCRARRLVPCATCESGRWLYEAARGTAAGSPPTPIDPCVMSVDR